MKPPTPSEGKHLSTLVPLLHYSPKSAEDKGSKRPPFVTEETNVLTLLMVTEDGTSHLCPLEQML